MLSLARRLHHRSNPCLHQAAAHQIRHARTDAAASSSPSRRRRPSSGLALMGCFEHEPWCKRYTELYQELRENWERLYWDEGYSKKLAQDHANYDSAGDDDQDFSPYRTVRRRPYAEQMKDQGMGRNMQDDTWEKVNQIRDKFEYDREKRMRERAFAPMDRGTGFVLDDSGSNNRPFDARRYFPQSERG
ncbi:hypothetical protein C3L33_04393, partial [Rhododendron williamsianum]